MVPRNQHAQTTGNIKISLLSEKPISFLILEDEEVKYTAALIVLTRLFQNRTLVRVTNPDDFIKEAKTGDYDICITDYNLKGFDKKGAEAVNELRAWEKSTKNTKQIVNVIFSNSAGQSHLFTNANINGQFNPGEKVSIMGLKANIAFTTAIERIVKEKYSIGLNQPISASCPAASLIKLSSSDDEKTAYFTMSSDEYHTPEGSPATSPKKPQ